MIAIILDAGAPAACEPLTCTRNLAAIPVANLPLQEQQLERLIQCGLLPAAEAGEAEATGRCLYQRGDAWLSHDAIYLLRNTLKPAVLRDATGEPLAWTGNTPVPPENAQVLTADDTCLLIHYPWDLLRVNELLVGAIEKNSYPGRLDDRVEVQGRVIIGRNTRVLPGTFIEDNVIIGRNCKIGPNCYLRGNTAIGDDCHIGQAVEIKNSILMNRVAIGHLSYCGDSIVGEGTNFGAGTITANFRHDGKNHRSMIAGSLVDTRRKKFGAIIGDDVHTGIHTSIYPGRKLWPHCWTRPGDIVQKDLHGM